MNKVIHAACPHDCPDACGVLISIEGANGSVRATRIQGDPAHPVTRGFLCAKVAKYLDRVYSPDRLLYPMRRGTPKRNRGASPRRGSPSPVGGDPPKNHPPARPEVARHRPPAHLSPHFRRHAPLS